MSTDTARYHPMADEAFDYANLDPGIRDVVRKLREHGFDACDSGDGVSKPADWYTSGEAMPFPHVAAAIPDALHDPFAGIRIITEGRRMQELLGDAWDVEATFWPKTGSIILLATKNAKADAGERDDVAGAPV